MKATHNFYTRIRTKGVPEYRQQQAFAFAGKLLGAPKMIVEPTDDFSDEGTLLYTVQVPKDVARDELNAALRDTFERAGGCGHDYDCCGCRCDSVWTHKTRRLRRGQFQFQLHMARNY